MTNARQPRQPLAVDVLVVGAGCAGVAAAVGAGEEGAATLLVDAAGCVGDTLAGHLLEHGGGFYTIDGQQVVAGFAQRLVGQMRQTGASPGHAHDDAGDTATRAPINPTALMLTEARCLHDAGVGLWLHAPLVAVKRHRNRIVYCAFSTPSGVRWVAPRMVIDTSGDAVAAHLALAGFQPDTATERQPASLQFTLSGVDFAALMHYVRGHAEEFRPGGHFPAAPEDHVDLWGFASLLRQGYQEGSLSLARNEMHIAGWAKRGELGVNVTRYDGQEPDGADHAGQAWLTLCRQIVEYDHWFRRCVPGCARAYVSAIGGQVDGRVSRRVLGRYTVTQHDVLHGVRFHDSIACGGFPIKSPFADQPDLAPADRPGQGFEVAYRSLLPVKPDNLLVAGRCLSSDHAANRALRVTATCLATGEAAGVAAALAVRQGCPPALIAVDQLRLRLRQRGAIVSLDGDAS
ncbi:FAD-dependent oxidoreductase [Acerihabitans sp.]|uniref:FAD-dependent oxidoreductase n=1 Tax=Acerihabitans sp. TaxID=2811394 RepID=UPI002EDB910F